MDACPTDAFIDARVLDASKCISYLTIELKDEIPGDFRGQYQDWVFGCDICQDVCPWNRFSQPHHEPEFNILEGIHKIQNGKWDAVSEDEFNKLLKRSPLKRTKYKGLKRNIDFVNKKPHK